MPSHESSQAPSGPAAPGQAPIPAYEGPDGAAAPRRWTATELGARVVSAIVLALAALVVTYAGGWLFVLFWLLAGVAILAEWLAMTRVEPRLALQIGLGAALIVISVLLGAGMGPTAPALLALAAVGAAALLARGSRGRLWAASGFAYAAVITVVPPLVREHPDLAVVGILWMFAVVWVTDTAAYFTGRRLGGPKLWPRVSPKKTWSGFIGGLLGGTLCGVVIVWGGHRYGSAPPFGLSVVALFSAVASVASQLGDLGESALKRAFGAKDSSHLIPGHGGVMDRLDGFWAVALLVGLGLLVTSL